MPVCKFWLQGNCKYGNLIIPEAVKGRQATLAETGIRGARGINITPDTMIPAVTLVEIPGVKEGEGEVVVEVEEDEAVEGQEEVLAPATTEENLKTDTDGPAITSSDYGLYPDKIHDDLTKELPQWILSAYGPGRAAVVPRQLFGGVPRELSFEELRLRQYELATGGNQQQAFKIEQDLFREADEQNKQALRQLDKAISYIMDGADEHPNRIDIANGSTGGGRQGDGVGHQLSNQFSSANPFQSAENQVPRPFGQPARFATNGFPTATDVSMNTPAIPAFGQNPFNTGATASSFGPVSQAQPLNGFAKPSQPAAALDALGRPIQPTSIFGQTTQAAAGSGPFGVPTRPSADSNPFQTIQSAPTPFGTASQQAIAPTSFSNFASPSNTLSGGAVANGLGTSKLPSSSDVVPPGQTLRIWKGKPVVYEDHEPYMKLPGGKLARIWFPHGPPELSNDEGVGKADDLALKERYRKAEETGTFGECQVPEIAPRMEWVNWDF